MSIKRRLSGLEKVANKAAESGPPWSPPEVYDKLREDARDEIERALEIGVKPLFWIDDAGLIRAADDDSFVRHLGDYIRAGDREMRSLDREIAEARANISPEEIQRADAEYRKSCDALIKLSFDEGIAFLEAAIAADEGEGGGGSS